jgi:hypothetical protein
MVKRAHFNQAENMQVAALLAATHASYRADCKNRKLALFRSPCITWLRCGLGPVIPGSARPDVGATNEDGINAANSAMFQFGLAKWLIWQMEAAICEDEFTILHSK